MVEILEVEEAVAFTPTPSGTAVGCWRPTCRHRYVAYPCYPLLVGKEEGPSLGHRLKAVHGANIGRALSCPHGERRLLIWSATFLLTRRPSPTLSPGGTGCKAFVVSLQNVLWPLKFRPNLTEKYDGSINPSEFLQIYTTIIVVAGGDYRVMANYFPMALKDQARGWLMTQPPDSIHSWEDLCQQFVTNFQEKIASKEPKTTAELFELADKVARKEEAWAWNSPGTGAAATAAPESAPHSKWRDRRGKRKPARSDDEGHVLAADGPARAPCKGKDTGDKTISTAPSGEGRSADKWCSVHNTYRHSLADCRSVKNLAERFRKADEEKRQGRREGKAPATSTGNRREEAKNKAPADDGGDSEDLDFQIPQGTVATLDGGGGGACAHTSRRGFKAMRRELLAAVPTHEAARKARWSEVKLTFDQSDHPTVLARGGKLALVVSPTIHNVRMKRVLVEWRASLSIISPAAFDALKAPGMKLQPSLPIIGVTPGHTWPLGHVELPMTFGDSTNFRTERNDFDVADLNLPYNAVLGRPTLVKFMAATHYAYLQMKMQGPAGPITVFGDVKVALTCAEQCADNLAVATEPQAPEASASRLQEAPHLG
ncbi:uncharacterized protein [Oryza sativa Japonica Group]|uniref:uncharacterized protein n=1 Tax=Oryza sativa subsp. japonica TaxID=39947 RepID=UPI00339CDB7C